MSPRRTRRGTIRENVCDTSIINNSSKSATKKLKSIKSIDKSLSAKSSEEDNNENLTEIIDFVDNNVSLNFVNETSRNTRKHRRKGLENNDHSTSVLEQPTTRTRSRRNNLKTPNTKEQIKNNRSEIIDFSSLISEDESTNLKSKNDDKLAISVADSLISENEEIHERKLRKKILSETSENLSKSKKKNVLNKQNLSTSRKNIQLDNQNVSFCTRDCKTPEKSFIQKESNHAKSSVEITPKSSPLNVSLTPNRSTKTPKRSPVNLGSPKTHSRNSIRTLNVPRKLPVAEASPVSEKSSESLQVLNVSNTANISMPKKNSRLQSNIRQSLTPKIRLSKSPKIVLKTPKLKSKNSPGKKLLEIDSISKQEQSSLLKVHNKSTRNKSLVKSKKSPKLSTSLKSTNTCNVNSKTVQPQASILPVVSLEPLPTNSSIVTESQITSANSTKLINNATPTKCKRLPLNLSSKSKALGTLLSKSITEVSIPKSKKSPKIILPLSSKKMPKIVLLLKPKKSMKASRSLSPSKLKKALNANTHSKKESSSSKLLNRKSLPTNSVTHDPLISPRVIINKLSAPALKDSILNMKKNLPIINLVPSDHKTNKDCLASPKIQECQYSKKSIVTSLTPAKSDNIQVNSSKKVSLNSKNLSFKTHTPSDILEKKFLNLKPTNTSTPREKLKRTLTISLNKNNLTPKEENGIVFNNSHISKSKVIKRLNNETKKINRQLLEDESEPFMNDTSLIRMSDVFETDNSHKNNTFEVDKSNLDDSGIRKSVQNFSNNSNFDDALDKSDKFVKDNTYELEYPKTPGLQNRINKRSIDVAGLNRNESQDLKKLCHVHFASPNLGNQIRSSGINRISTPGHAIHSKRTPVQISKIKTQNQSLTDKTKSKNRTNIVPTSISKVNGNRSNVKRHSNVLSNPTSRKSNHEIQMDSVNRLSRPKFVVNSSKKSGLKTPVPIKIPNFAEIHQKNFAKMESLVDLKKRIEKRHVTINTATSSTKKDKPVVCNVNKVAPESGTNGTYNRFGFKMRKNDAVDIISKKAVGGIDSRDKKRETARIALKGVRMNRRFELQMKTRSQNS